MTKLSTEQLLYLLYTVVYSPEGTVTKGAIKDCLPKDFKKDANVICDALSQQKLIESPKKGRLSVTAQGRKALVATLQATTYQFNSPKGPKVLNTLLELFKEASFDAQTSAPLVEEIEFDTFLSKFKALYFEERKRQELRGVAVIRSREICEKFMERTTIAQSKLDKYFDMLKATGKVFAVIEKGGELIQWAE